MKKTKLTRSLLAACSIVALSAVMYGCVHDGGDDPAPEPTTTEPPAPEPEPEPEPMEPTPEEVMLPRALGMYLDAADMPMAGEMTIAAGMSYTNNAVVFSCAAGGDDCVVTVDANGMATSTGGMVTAALTAEAMERAEEAEMAAMLERRDRIIGLDRALEAAANLPATGTANALDEDEIIINRGPSGPASVTSTGFMASDDPALANGGWAGTRLTQTVAGATQHLVVYTDKEPATRIQFYNWDGSALTPSLYADTVTDALTAPADASTVITPLPLVFTGAGAILSASTADSTRFPATPSPEDGSSMQTYAINDASTPGGANDRVSIPGNYNGAGGRYLCTPASGTTCSVTAAPSGAYSSADTWTFVPELNSTAWVEDGGTAAGAGGGQQGDFMSFGWWLQVPAGQTGPYTFRYYADGTAYSLASGSNLAAGSATYNGRAAGRYVVQTIDDEGVTGGMSGEFVAAASLTATFSGTGAGGMIEGSITGFQGANGSMSDWSVTLAEQTLTDTSGTSVTSAGTVNDPTLATFDGATATMGSQTAHGTWSSQFFGQPATADAYPLGVGGTFQADNEAVSIAGAFGARR